MENLLNLPLIGETRRNHALEHAAVNILSERFPNKGMGGHSNPTGFFIVGDLPTEAVRDAVTEALARLENGEKHLAIHPGCGTNYVATGGLAALFAIVGMLGTKNTRQRLERFPLLVMLSMGAFILGQALGPSLQREITTDANPRGLTIVRVEKVGKNLHRVVTR